MRGLKSSSGEPPEAALCTRSGPAATLAAVLHRQAGAAAAAMTPMDLLHGGALGRGVSVLLSTAGGNNADIVTAFEAAVAAPGRNVCAASAGGGGRAGRRCCRRRRPPRRRQTLRRAGGYAPQDGLVPRPVERVEQRHADALAVAEQAKLRCTAAILFGPAVLGPARSPHARV